MGGDSTFADRLRGGRLRLRLTLDEMALRVGVSRTYIWELEGGRDPAPVPGADVLCRLADGLGMTMESLWRGSATDPAEALRRAAMALEAIAKEAGIPPLPPHDSEVKRAAGD